MCSMVLRRGNSVRAINANLEPESWDTRLEILQIRKRRSLFNWNFVWSPRSTSTAADRVAKLSFVFGFFFYASTFVHIKSMRGGEGLMCNPLV